MQTHYVFVDYENTPLGNIGLINKIPCKTLIKIYLGHHQSMIPLSVARALQALGEDAEYIQFESTRRNITNFNIAFQLGELATQHPEARFSILSNDSGFNAILEGLQSRGVNCARYADMESLMEQFAVVAPVAQENIRAKNVVAIAN